jgi:LPS export ABC transporter protein LptC
MYLSRKQSIAAAFGLIAGFLLLIFILRPKAPQLAAKLEQSSALQQGSEQLESGENSQQTVEGVGVGLSLQGPELRLKKFHRSETKNGKKIWEVIANGAVYKPATGATSVEEALVHFFRENGDVIDLTASKASLNLDAGTLSSGDFFGGVTVALNKDVTVSSESAHYDKAANLVTSTEPVTVIQKAMTLKGDTLVADLNTDTFELKGNILTILDPERLEKQAGIAEDPQSSAGGKDRNKGTKKNRSQTKKVKLSHVQDK